MEFEEVIEHYARPLVRKEISDYCQGRWVAVECITLASTKDERTYAKKV